MLDLDVSRCLRARACSGSYIHIVVILDATLPEVGKGIVGLRKAWGVLRVALVPWESGIKAKERHGRLDARRAKGCCKSGMGS